MLKRTKSLGGEKRPLNVVDFSPESYIWVHLNASKEGT